MAALEPTTVTGEAGNQADGQASAQAALRELWVSFGSLARSYVAAAQLGQDPPLALVAQPSESALELVSPTRLLKLTLEAGGARGYWALYQAPIEDPDALLADGAFRIGLDSLIEWTGLPGRQPMDAVAEALATLILE